MDHRANRARINASLLAEATGAHTWLDGGGPEWNCYIAGRMPHPEHYVEFAVARFNNEPPGTLGVYVAFYKMTKDVPAFPASVEDPCAKLGNPIANPYLAVDVDTDKGKWTPETVKRIADSIKELCS